MAVPCMYSKDSLVRVCGGAGGATQPILKDRGAMKLCRDSIVRPNRGGSSAGAVELQHHLKIGPMQL